MDHDYIHLFKDIIREEAEESNSQLSQHCIDRLKDPLILENLVQIMVCLPEIDEDLHIGFGTKINIYNHLFHESVYDQVFQKMVESDQMENGEYSKYYLYGAILCELVKRDLYKKAYEYLENDDDKTIPLRDGVLLSDPSLDGSKKAEATLAVKSVFIDEMEECNKVILKLYHHIQSLFLDDSLFQETVELLQMNQIGFEE